jgi:CheY-like chemotaxis protein
MDPIGPRGPAAVPAAIPGDILIVEDDAIIALDFEETLLSLGVATVRTAASVDQALVLIAARAPDFALLDVGLFDENSFAVAGRLRELNIRFAFVTGYSGDKRFPAAYREVPRLSKPYSREALLAVLMDQPAADPIG